MDIVQRVYPYYFKLFSLNKNSFQQKRLVKEIQKLERINVTFIVSSLAMWRIQKVYDLLSSDPRFHPSILIYPFQNYDKNEQQKCSLELEQFFASKGIAFQNATDYSSPGRALREKLCPDIIFYPQPYHCIYGNDLDSDFFEDKLICYVHYSINILDESWVFNQRLTNLAWRVFYSSYSDKESSQKYNLNKGRNVRIVGCPLADWFNNGPETNPWKKQDKDKKRIIWAPHYSIPNSSLIQRGHFLELSELMIRLLDEYHDSIQFSFKPHPRLFSELINHPDWGEKRATEYYQLWANRDNSQLETGAYTDLFMTSDSMIHDCCSFSAEYLFTRHPVLFTSSDLTAAKKGLNEIGLRALDAHYTGFSPDNLRFFIDNVVIAGNDPMKEVRESFHEKYLRPPGGQSVAENIYNEILKSIGFDR